MDIINYRQQSETFSTKQLIAISLLLAGRSGRDIAKEIDVQEQSISRWKQLPSFKTALEEGQAEILKSSKCKLIALFEKSLDTLAESLDSDEEKYRLKAAATLTSIATKVPAAEADPAIQMSDAALQAEIERIERDVMGRDQTARDVAVDRGDAKEGADGRDRTALDVTTQKPGEA